MKRILLLPLLAALALGAGACQKQQTEAERKAEIERQVQQRLDAERRGDDRKKMAQRQAELEAQVEALAAKQKRPVTTAAPVVTESSSPATIASVPETENGSYSTFYRKLDPYGDWMETGDYGYVFQPRQAAQSRDWRPYANGHWVYTDAGWTWISEEKFGWATYHYGRWVRLRSVGWVWVPGEEWAPAWVSWRKGGDYVGWAPLPPEAQFDRQTGIQNWADNYYDIGPEQYAFVPANEFGRKLSPREILPAERNVTIINQTINVTNIVYNDSLIVDRGPSYDDLRSRSRQPIERYRLERTNDPNNEVPVFRGEIVALPTADFHPERAARPNRVVRTIAQPVAERGWAGVQDAQAAKKARAKMQSEATPPANLPPKRFVRPEQRTPLLPRPAPVNVGIPTSSPVAAPTIPAGTPTPILASLPGAKPRPRGTPPSPTTPTVTATPTASSSPGRPGNRPLPTLTPAPSAEPTQSSHAENISSPEKVDRNRHDAVHGAQEEKRKERRLEGSGRRGKKEGQPEATPTTTPSATATHTAAALNATPFASPTATAASGENPADQRRGKKRKKKRENGETNPEVSPGA